MLDTRLIIVTGMSGAGKSTTSKSLARQYSLNGVRCRWLHEEMKNHPIRDGEFSVGPLDNEEAMERNMQDMVRRWQRLVKRILRSKSVYIMEGTLYDNIIRYFFVGNTPPDKVAEYFDRIMQAMEPARPTVVFLYRADVRATLESLYPLRGMWWKNLILDPSGYGYCQARGLVGAEGVYRMWEDYQALSEVMFQRFQGRKIKIDTTGGQYDRDMDRLTQFLGIQHLRPAEVEVDNPRQYCGQYAVQVDEKLHTITIEQDGSHLYCCAFWPYMKLMPLGGSRFEFASFPVTLTFQKDGSGKMASVRVSGNYDWEIVGTTMQYV